MTIFLFEDDQEDLERLRTALSKTYNLIKTQTIEEALSKISAVDFDVAIVDVFINQKPEGIKLAKIITTLLPKKPIIFLTSSLDRTVFELAKYTMPTSYLIKPFNPIELEYAIELAFEEFTNQPAAFSINNGVTLDNCIFIKSNKTISKVNIHDIIYVETDSNYCSLITKNKKFLIRISLQKLMEKTLKPLFIQVHRNYGVNIDMIKQIYLKDNLVVMNNDEKITLSYRFKSQFLKTMRIFQ